MCRTRGPTAYVMKLLRWLPLLVPMAATSLAAQDTTRADTTRRLPEVTVAAPRQSVELGRVGYYERVKSGWGEYLAPDQVERLRGVRQTTSMLQGMRGVRLECGHGMNNAILPCSVGGTAGVCMTMIVDGVMLRGAMLDERVSPNMVHAIEVYSTPGKVPATALRSADQLACGAVMVWTRGGLGLTEEKPRDSFKRRLMYVAIAGGVLFGITSLF